MHQDISDKYFMILLPQHLFAIFGIEWNVKGALVIVHAVRLEDKLGWWTKVDSALFIKTLLNCIICLSWHNWHN